MADVFSLEVMIKAVDMFSGPIKSMISQMSVADTKMKSISNTMKLMGKSKSEIDAINASLNKMADQKAFANIASDLQKVGMARQDIAAMEGNYMRMAAYQRDMSAAQAKYAAGKDLAMSGVSSLTTGAIGAFGIVEMLKQAGDFQDQLVTIQDSTGATNKEMVNFGNAIKMTSAQVSKFNDMQVSGMAKQLASGGFNKISQVQAVLPTVAKFAEVQAYEGKQTDPTASVQQAIEMAHTYGHYDPKSFMNFLNNFNKYSLMQPGDSTQLQQTMKYLAPTANMLHMSEASSMALAAVDNTLGLSGSHGGTNSADMIMRLIPGLIGGSPTAKKTPAAWAAMEKLGFIDKNGNSSFFNKKGGIVDTNQLLTTMINDSKKFNPMQLTTLYKQIFGIQGGRAAAILAQPRSMEQLSKMQSQLGKTKNIDQMTSDYQKTASGQMNLMKSNSMSIMLTVAQQLAVALNPVLQKINAIVSATLKFSIAHPTFTKIIADLALLAVGGKLFEGSLKLGFGALKMLDGGFGMLKIASKAKELTTLGKVVSGLKGAFTTAKDGVMLFGSQSLTMFKSFGSGILGLGKTVGSWVAETAVSFGKVAASAAVSFGKMISEGAVWAAETAVSFGKAAASAIASFAKMIAEGAVWAAETAADWLIAMGPVVWIIAGVTALIAAGIIMWKTNFLGFRDGLKAVWNVVRSDAGSAWNWIKTTAQGVVNWFQNLPGQMMQIGQNMMQGLINGISSMVGSIGSTMQNIGSSVVSTFKNILGIHSPSKVFAEHGKYIVQGLALGIDKNAYVANQSTNRLANGVVNGFRPNVSNGSVSLAGGSGAINIHPGAIVIQGGNASAQEIAQMVLTKLGQATRTNLMNTGSSLNIASF